MSQPITASIDLAQLDSIEAFSRAADPTGAMHLVTHYRRNADLQAEEAWRIAVNPATMLQLIALARRSLTSGAPAALSYADAAQWARSNGLNVPEAWSAGAAAKTEQDNANYQKGWRDGNDAGRGAIEIHLESMKNNRHYRERIFNQILKIDADEGLQRFQRVLAAGAGSAQPLSATSVKPLCSASGEESAQPRAEGDERG